MKYDIRLAREDDIAPALDVAWRMFLKYDSSDYGVEHTEQTEFLCYLLTVNIST